MRTSLKNLFHHTRLAILISLVAILTACKGKVPSEYVGDWEGQINPSQKIVLNISKDGKYELKIYQKRERYDAIYKGEVVIYEGDSFIKLPSTSYTREYNSNRRESDPFWSFVDAETDFYFDKSGALSKSPQGLINPYGYLHKIK